MFMIVVRMRKRFNRFYGTARALNFLSVRVCRTVILKLSLRRILRAVFKRVTIIDLRCSTDCNR